jgi:hypothetical protein
VLGINLGHWQSRGLFIFKFCRRLLFNEFSFPLSTDKSLGYFHVNRRFALNFRCISPFLIGGRWRCRGDRGCEGDGDGEGEGDLVREMRGDGDI